MYDNKSNFSYCPNYDNKKSFVSLMSSPLIFRNQPACYSCLAILLIANN